MTLSKVVLPEPFGPIRPKTSPRASHSDTSASASTPPKRLPTPSRTRVFGPPTAGSTSGRRGGTTGAGCAPRSRSIRPASPSGAHSTTASVATA